MLQLHVLAKFTLSLARVGTDLTNQRLGLVTELVAVQLVNTMTAV